MKLQSSIWLTTTAMAVITFVCSSNLGIAAENSAIDPTGTWRIARINAETKSRGLEQTLKLKLENGKLTGTITGGSSHNGKVRIFEWPIKDTKLRGSEIAFSVTHAPVTGNGPDATTIYEGTITNDTMKGKFEAEWNGNTFKGDWQAKRVKE
jgi:hypothetical protein